MIRKRLISVKVSSKIVTNFVLIVMITSSFSIGGLLMQNSAGGEIFIEEQSHALVWNFNILDSDNENYEYMAKTPAYTVYFDNEPGYVFVNNNEKLEYRPSGLEIKEYELLETFVTDKNGSKKSSYQEFWTTKTIYPKSNRPTIEGTQIVYPDIYGLNNDLIYDITFFHVKETYQIDKALSLKKHDLKFEGDLNFGSNSSSSLKGKTENGRNQGDLIISKNATNNQSSSAEVKISNPIFETSNGRSVDGEFCYANDKYDLLVSNEFLSSDIEYPIYIDPITSPVSTEDYYVNEVIEVNSDITVEDGGKLFLINVTLQFNYD